MDVRTELRINYVVFPDVCIDMQRKKIHQFDLYLKMQDAIMGLWNIFYMRNAWKQSMETVVDVTILPVAIIRFAIYILGWKFIDDDHVNNGNLPLLLQ